MLFFLTKIFKIKTYTDRLQDTLELDPRQVAIPGRCQVPGDEHLQVDGLEDLNVMLRGVLLQQGSKQPFIMLVTANRTDWTWTCCYLDSFS